MTAIISGSFYQHKYKYLSPFTNAHWRGMYFLHEVRTASSTRWRCRSTT
jgi:hypothetical protein